jgi:hypothetical protein
MTLSERDPEFVANNRSAVMVTLKADGTPHVARVGVGLVGGKLWSTGTQGRLRTKHLRRDPRCSASVGRRERSGHTAEAWSTEDRGRHPDRARPAASPRGSPSRPLSSVTASTFSPGIRERPSFASLRAPIC